MSTDLKLPSLQISRNKLAFVVHLVLWLILVFQTTGSLLPGLKEGDSFGIYHELKDGVDLLTIIDFPYHFNIVKKAWESKTTFGSGLSIYSAQSQIKATSDWAGSQISETLIFGYSPTVLWVLLPLVPFSHATAFFLFNVAGLLAVYWMTYPGRTRWGIGILLFFSTIANACFGLGQTAILTGAGLLFLAEKTCDGNSVNDWRDELIAGSVLWALTAKPPVAVIAVAALAGLRRWRTLAAAGILTIISTLVLMPWLGDNWIRDYWRVITSYTAVGGGPQYAWSVHPEYLSNLRGLLNVNMALPDDLASTMSLLVWLGAIVSLVIAGLRFFVSARRLWSLSIVLYFLFCPHVTRTELLQISVILSLSVSTGNKLSWGEILLLPALPLFILLLRPLGPPLHSFVPLVVLLGCLIFFPDDQRRPCLMKHSKV